MLRARPDATALEPAAVELLDAAATVLNRQFGCPFALFELNSMEPVGGPSPGCELLVDAARLARDHDVAIQTISPALQALVVRLTIEEQPRFAAVGLFARRLLGPAEMDELTRLLGPDAGPHRIPFCQSDLLEQLGSAARECIRERMQLSSTQAQLTQLASHVSRNYEEITLLHQLTGEAQISQGTAAVQELALSLLAEVLPAVQIVSVEPGHRTDFSIGPAALEPDQCRALTTTLSAAPARRSLVVNHPEPELARQFPKLERFVAAPVGQGDKQFGWLLAINTADGSELGSVEASLMTAVASILATHRTNVELFQDVEDLFLGVVRALSSAIDAKDPYTSGHSERVGQVARRLGQELGLPEPDSNQLYLSGLLHDVGKIGIRDAVLLKSGLLTPEEFEHMKEHPRIGFEILSGVRQLAGVLPGVRNHHENFDGTGYPDRLKGEAIPLMARIMAVADAYDAMSSDRPYRKGLAQDRVLQIFREGSGSQWDGHVVEAFLRIHSELRRNTDLATPPAGTSRAMPVSLRTASGADLRRISRFLAAASA
jgi:HD-GYP domain-containing protein (c-di-GMP phosphodiesterase class II)